MRAPRDFFGEVRRRNVLRAAVLYLGAAWALAQGIAQLGPTFGAPEWITRWFVFAAAIGFPLWLALAWFYEWTPQGLRREREAGDVDPLARPTHRVLDVAIIGVLAIAVVLLVTDRYVAHGDRGPSAKSIAVLPFVDMSGEANQAYFGDGIAEELLNLLTKIPDLRVISRSSAFSFKGKAVDVSEIARRLNVAHVLEGSVRKAGDRVRVTAELIDARADTTLWSQSWDRKVDDILDVQDEIAAAVVNELKVTMLGTRRTAKIDPKAHELMVQARQLARLTTKEGYEQALAALDQAVAIDPGYAAAWDQKAFVYYSLEWAGIRESKDVRPLFEDAIARALAADPEFAPAYAHLGQTALADGDLATAAVQLQKAARLDPTNAIVLATSSDLLDSLGRLEESLAIGRYIVVRDPINPSSLVNIADTLMKVGRFDEALADLRTAHSLTPERQSALTLMVNALIFSGRPADALAMVDQIHSETVRAFFRPVILHALGRHAESDAALAAWIEKYGSADPSATAEILAFRGEKDRAFEWLDKIPSDKMGFIGSSARPWFFALRDDPRWLPELRRIGVAPEQLAKIRFDVTVPTGDAAREGDKQ